MAVYSRQEALSTTPELVLTAEQIRRANASNSIQVAIRNDDASISIYVGESDVDATNGFEVEADTTFSYEIRSVDELLYVVAASGTPTCHIIAIGPVAV
jgi:hypothetical protein